MEREIEQNVSNTAQVDVIKVQSERLQSAEAAREQLQRSLSTVCTPLFPRISSVL